VARPPALGRGLGALIPGIDPGERVTELPLSEVHRNPRQPRDRFDADDLGQLAASITAHGLLQPIVVRPRADGGYELVAGERRLRAARLAGLDRIAAVVRDASDADQLEMAVIENVQRADLNPVEAATAYRDLVDRFGLTQEEVARRVGKSRVAITNALRLLELEAESRAAIVDGRITEGHGRALAGLQDRDAQLAALDGVIRRQLSVRQTEEMVRRNRRQRPRTAPDRPGELADLEARLRLSLATKVAITRSRRGGRLTVEFYSDEELDRIVAIISRGAQTSAGQPTREPGETA
jgi:ParB family chromosome partitioning protein